MVEKKAKEEKPETVKTEKTVKKAATKPKTTKVEKPELAVEVKEKVEVPVAKAGKRSTKALEEAELKEKKTAAKATAKTEDAKEKPKPSQKPPRNRLERAGKSYRKLAGQIDQAKNYSLAEAVDLAIKTNPSKFDATIELHARLGVDPKHADQNIRDTILLPAGSGKTLKVAVLGNDDQLKAAKAAGSDVNLSDDMLLTLDKGEVNFDILITTPEQMPKLAKFARFLGPKGLMPNPKNGTVTNNLEKAVKEAKTGKVEYRIDSTGIIHLGIGKVSFGNAKILENAQAVISSIKSNKPSSIKANYINSIYLATTMGPSVKVDKSNV
ncbi:MAG TPA: 50S ribosomal protein L1 [Candidatus Saccharimonadales bacterium]|nr:50S ribosomal protein L1 [Candidatus Saccharimonadales bacterium]